VVHYLPKLKSISHGLFRKCVALSLFSAVTCQTQHQACTQTQTAFYYWKTSFALDQIAQVKLADKACSTLFVRYFDIVVDQTAAVPNAILEWREPLPVHLVAIPVVYITNEVWQKTPKAQDDSLSWRLIELVRTVSEQGEAPNYQELQLDCDWSPSTKDRYFEFLRLLRARLPKHVRMSATIRLHQYKRPDLTGVPPSIDYGMLMLYNTGQVTSMNEENSILQAKDIQKWVKNTKPYPLDLNIALPDFGWAVVFRLGEFVHLIHAFPEAALANPDNFEQISTTQYRCKRNHIVDGYYLHMDDLIRTERADPAVVKTISEAIEAQNNRKSCIFAYFHL
jgi:hypothetical protein